MPRRVAKPPQASLAETAASALSIGERMNWARLRKGMTQQELGKRIGRGRTTIVAYEHGRVEPPMVQLADLAAALQVSPEFLAFGRQGVDAPAAGVSDLVALTEVEPGESGEVVLGGYAFPRAMAEQFGIIEGARVFALKHDAPEFGFGAGDRVIVNPVSGLVPEHQIYLLRSTAGVELVRLVPSLAAGGKAINLVGSNGQLYSLDPGELDILGAVVGSIRRA